MGEGILLDGATGVVIGETAVIGDRVSLMQVSASSFFCKLAMRLEFQIDVIVTHRGCNVYRLNHIKRLN